MSDYIRINHYERGGELAISREVFEKIVVDALNSPEVNKKAKAKDEVKVIFKKDGKVSIKVHLIVKKGEKPAEVSQMVQLEIARYLEVYVESVPVEIQISVDEIK